MFGHRTILPADGLLDGDTSSCCCFDEMLVFDAKLALEHFVGLCGRLRLAHSGEVVAHFALSSGFMVDHDSRPLLVRLSRDAGQVQVECNLHASGEFDAQRLASACRDAHLL
jgi:hypothetical protein